MPFSSSICLTNTGTLPLGSSVDIYSNSDSYSVPFQTNISLSLLTSNCPYILTNIPDGTTQIKFQDIVSHCCYNLSISNNNLCDLYSIQLSGFSSTTVSQIVAGLLVGSVGATITDYIIDWYGPDNNTTVSFTSGYGTAFNNIPYQQTHPFTRVSLPGYYIPMIRQIRINGINYSITGGTGFIQSNINCLGNQTVEVFPSTCSGNREEPVYFYPNYNNYYFSNTSANNTPPESLSMGFDLDINSNYFAWQFNANIVSDTIKITFYGDNYSEPIVLEYYTIGYEYTQTNVSVTPKIIKVDPSLFFRKVTNLSNFLRSENDYLTIEVTPNPTISTTDWSLYFKCLNTFNCETCLDSLSPYKIIQSSVVITPLSCNQYKFQANLSGCTEQIIQNSDIYKYISGSGEADALNNVFYGWVSSPDGIIPYSSINSSGNTFCGDVGIVQLDTGCSDIVGNRTTFQKTNDGPGGSGRIYMTFGSLSDLSVYYGSYLNIFNAGLGTPFDNTNIDYYRFFTLTVPIIPIDRLNRTCAADVGNVAIYNIHTSSVVTTGLTGSIYWMNVTMPLITDGISFNSCDLGCDDRVSSYLINVNTSSISELNQYNFTSNIGAKKLNPFNSYIKLIISTVTGSQNNQQAFLRLTDLVNDTIPMSGNTYTPIPSLSISNCDLSTYLFGGTYLGVSRYTKFAWYLLYSVSPINTIQVFVSSSSLLIYEYDINTNTILYIDNFYFIAPNITLSSSTISNLSVPIPVGFKNNTNCGESNDSPAMSWTINSYTSGTTQTITSYEILCEDIDATGSSPDGYFIHWYVIGITSGQTSINVNGSWNGSPTIIPTDYGSGDRANGWNGPCPPSGTHNYRIQVKARLSDNTTLTSNYLTFTST